MNLTKKWLLKRLEITRFIFQLNKCWRIKLKKKYELKGKKILVESFKSRLISQTRNPWNPRSGFNRETQFPINLILKDEIKKILIFKFFKAKRNSNKKNNDQIFF